ncbi:DNA cytosine methyltransferase [bacterium]|nr:DNA cytosine methyltransferase [bacterium]
MEGSKFLDQSGSIPDAGTLTVGSLFSGIGGFELGFEATGRFETRWQIECDAYATKVLAKHWPDVYRHDDVCTWPNEKTEPVDVIIGGFPCQDISYAGKGAGLDGKRSGLFYELMRIVRVVGPQYVVLENVAALFTRGMDQVLGTLASHGYDAEWEVVSAASVGAPHRRDRVFIIGYLADSDSTQRERSGIPSGIHAGDPNINSASFGRREEKDVADSSSLRQSGSGMYGRPIDTTESSNWKASDVESSGQRKESHWHFEPSVGGTINGISRELDAGLTKFPQMWKRGQWEDGIPRVASGIKNRADRLKCLGNAIVPQVAKVVAERLLEIHDQNN